MDKRTDKQKSPCVLQDFVPFGAAAQKPHIPPNMPRMKTLADLENPEIDAVVLGKV